MKDREKKMVKERGREKYTQVIGPGDAQLLNKNLQSLLISSSFEKEDYKNTIQDTNTFLGKRNSAK